jgi:hypothetical protein
MTTWRLWSVAVLALVPVPGQPNVQLVLIPVPAGANVEAALPRVIESVGAKQGGIAQHAAPTQVSVQGKPVRVEAVSFNKVPNSYFFFLSSPGARAICMAAIPKGLEKTAARATGEACLTALGGNTAGANPAPARPASNKPAPPAAASALPAHPENWAKVADVYFRSVAGVGVGGMMIMDFEPLILFKDGSYYEIGDSALEDIDLAAERTRRPNDWGRWTRQGDRFVLTGTRGKPNDYALQQGQFFKAFPASGSASPLGSYKSVSGGGNTALGGEVMIASTNRYIFLPGGVLGTKRSTGAMSNGSVSGVGSTVAANRAGQGRYAVDRYTITLTLPDGRSQRRFFAFGSEKTPARLDKDMIFIGDTVYSLDD